MPNADFAGLFESVRLGQRIAPNRLAFTAHTTNLAVDGLPSEWQARYYARRAAGGVGLIVIEEVSVHPSNHPYQRVVRGYDEAVVPGYRRIAGAIHQHGSLALVQLNHAGMQGTGSIQKQVLWAPSAIANPATLEMPKVMEAEDIAAVIAGFARAAQLAIAGGFDGVEINAGQYSLVRQFLSGLTNQRGDAYGGTPEKRAHFALEVIQAVRAAVGAQAVVGLRLCGDEFAPWAGITPDEAPALARTLTQSGAVDYLSVVVGSLYSVYKTRAGMHTEPGYALDLARRVRHAVTVPVYATGSLVDPGMAAEAIASGAADGVEMTRALIADPDLLHKLRQHRVDAIRPCIRCNQDCVVRSAQNAIVSCIHNPEAGYEADFPPLVAADHPRRLLIIGGGPAGMETARIAALRGYRVVLLERTDQLGGTPRLVARAPQRTPMGLIADWLAGQLAQLDVEVQLAVEATRELVCTINADVVVLATGARPRPVESLPGGDLPHVYTVRDVLMGHVTGTGRVAIIDSQGSYPAIDAAQMLAAAGRPVTIVTEDLFVSAQLISSGEFHPWYQRAAALGIEFRPLTKVLAIESEALVVRHRFGTRQERIEGIATVVVANDELAEDRLYHDLKDIVPILHRVGDCLAPRRVLHAILEGNRVARAI
jgi:mycofactocin system FadH/OYE family oxidoreductase 2